MRWLLALALLASGCLSETVVKEKYVCSDGWVVDSSADCVGHERVCPDCKCPKCPACDCPADGEEVSLEYRAQVISQPEGMDECVSLGCPEGSSFVASKNSDKYHLCGCQWAKRISEKNLVCYVGEEEAVQDGKIPGSQCLGN